MPSNPERFSFDLIHEPWIPCERPDGTRELVGIHDALVRAHEFAVLQDESPLATATLHRLLLAILQHVFRPRNMEHWVALWEAERFDAVKVRGYLEQWKERFDLFDVERPFLQVPNLKSVLAAEKGKDVEATEAWRLPLETSQHSGATSLFEPLPTHPALRPAEAARALLGFLAFTSGGRIQNEAESWKSGPLRSGAVLLLRGSTLHRTLLSNLIWHREIAADDVPPWERDRFIARAVRAPFGPADLLIWPSRRVHLLPSRDARGCVVVPTIVTAAGERFDTDVRDAMFAYIVKDPKKPPVAVRIETDRSVWRDCTALFEAGGGADTAERPAACKQLSTLIKEGVVHSSARFDFQILGLASNQAAIEVWRDEKLPLPQALLHDGARIRVLRDALAVAEELGRKLDYDVLRVLAENALAPSDREAHKDDIRNLKQALGAMPHYWAVLGQAFPAWLDELGRAEDADALLVEWKRTLRATARDVAVKAELRLGDGARALQAGAKARRALNRTLREILGGDDPAVNSTLSTEAEATGAQT